MKIVIVAPRFPFPLDKGDRLTVYHLLEYLSRRHQVALVCFLEEEQDPAWAKEISPFCDHVEMVPLKQHRAYLNCAAEILGRTPLQVSYYRDPAMKQALRRVVEAMHPDLLYAHTIRMGQYIEPYRAYPRVLAMQISMTLNYLRLAEHASNWMSKLFFMTEYRKVRAFEAPYAHLFDRVLLISKHDLNAIEGGESLDNVFFSPHGVDFQYFAPDPNPTKEANTLILTGNMNYTPNVDAVTYFCSEILPLVRKQVPGVKVNLVGADPSPKVLAFAQEPGICVTSRVPDLRPYMNSAQVALAPLRIGAGLQNKVLEGMSMGLPMVITTVANEGIQAVDQEHLLIADTASVFADSIISLLTNAKQRVRLGNAARNFIIQQWSWEKHFLDLEQLFTSLVEQKELMRFP